MSLLTRTLSVVNVSRSASLSTAAAFADATRSELPVFPFHRKVSPKVQAMVEKSVSENTITIFSKSWCPHSKRAKALIQAEYPHLKARVYELDQIPEGGEIQAYLSQKTGQRIVPNIFLGKTHIGGCAAIHALNDKGELAAMLNSQ